MSAIAARCERVGAGIDSAAAPRTWRLPPPLGRRDADQRALDRGRAKRLVADAGQATRAVAIFPPSSVTTAAAPTTA